MSYLNDFITYFILLIIDYLFYGPLNIFHAKLAKNTD